MSHQRRLELRLLSTNSQLQLGQILSLATVSSRSSDSAETASAASKAIGVAGSPNGLPGAPISVRLPAEAIGAGPEEGRQIGGGDRAFRHRTAKQPVGRLADRQHDRRDPVRRRRRQPPAAKLGGAKAACGIGEAGDLGRIVEAVEGLSGIAAQHDGVRRVERKNAAGEAVRGPGYRHDAKSNR